MPLSPLTTQIVGSYVKPHWLARHARMGSFDGSWWRPEPEVLEDARLDAMRLAVYDQERAGLDVVTDGEMWRSAYDRHFLRGMHGIDFDRLEAVALAGQLDASPLAAEGQEEFVATSSLRPRVVGDIAWAGPTALDELRRLKSVATRPVKMTVAGPLTLAGRLADHHYGDETALTMALAGALNQELRVLDAEGVDVLQIDEPAFHFRLPLARRIGREAIGRVVAGINTPVIVHVCYGYAIVYRRKSASSGYPEVLEILSDCPITGISLEYEQPRHEPSILRHCGNKHVVLGLLDLGSNDVEHPAHIAARLRAALAVVPPERLHPASDCGMWYLDRMVAFGKIRSLVAATRSVAGYIGRL